MAYLGTTLIILIALLTFLLLGLILGLNLGSEKQILALKFCTASLLGAVIAFQVLNLMQLTR